MRVGVEKRTLMVIGLFGALTLTIIFLIILPFAQRIQELNKETFQLRDYLEKKHQRAMDYNQAVKTLEKIAPEAALYSANVFKNADKLKLITTLEDVATHNNVSQTITNSNIDSDTPLITMSLQISGSYQNVLQHIRDLETLDYFLNIRRVQMSAGTNPSTKQLTVTASIDASLYAN